MAIALRLNKTIDITDGYGRPAFHGSTGLTVERAASALAGCELAGYVEATWNVFEGDSFPPVAQQVAVKVRRLRKLADLIGRAVVRVESTGTGYRALLAR